MLLGKSGEIALAGPKQKRCTVADLSGAESKVQCCKEQCWNSTIGSMNQGELDVVKQEMEREDTKNLKSVN